MDEPFSALDTTTRASAQQEFMRLWSDETTSTAVLVTHDLTEALLLGDRVLMISNGQIVRELDVPFPRPRDLARLRTSPEFIALECDLARTSDPNSHDEGPEYEFV